MLALLLALRAIAALPAPPLLHTIENISHAGPLAELRRFYSAGGEAASFRVFLDSACGLPADWRATWDRPKQWGLTGERNWATKYGAAGFIPRMIDNSPFATADWRQASASVVVLFARQYAGGPAIVQQQCLQRLRARSEAFRATNGSRHFFIFTDSRGPCCLDGKYKDVDFLRHHVIGPHGEPTGGAAAAAAASASAQGKGKGGAWFFRRGHGPKIRCFDPSKDVNIPTPNIHFPRTPYAPKLHALPSPPPSRDLLLFYAGWNYDVRMKLVALYQNDAEVYVRRKVEPDEYVRRMLSARFCPVCGGFSQWTPRLAEALYYECVPVILSPSNLPPFGTVLDWSAFSVRLDPTSTNLARLKGTIKGLDHALLLRGVRAAKAALTYRLDGYTGADMLPLLLHEMWQVARVPIPPVPSVQLLRSDVETEHDYDVGLADTRSQRAHDVFASSTVRHEGVDWECSTKDGYMCSCKKGPNAKKGRAGRRAGGAKDRLLALPSPPAAAAAAAAPAVGAAAPAAGAVAPVRAHTRRPHASLDVERRALRAARAGAGQSRTGAIHALRCRARQPESSPPPGHDYRVPLHRRARRRRRRRRRRHRRHRRRRRRHLRPLAAATAGGR